MKKKHFVSYRFALPCGENYIYQGLVTGVEHAGKVLISVNKLFKNAFGFDMPAHTIIHG